MGFLYTFLAVLPAVAMGFYLKRRIEQGAKQLQEEIDDQRRIALLLSRVERIEAALKAHGIEIPPEGK